MTVSFFAEFADFKPDPTARLTEEFSRLALHRNWKDGSKTYKRQWNKCMETEFEALYGNNNYSRLESWQSLCQELGLDAPESIRKCKRVLSQVNVNIVDLMECRRNGGTPRMFPSVRALIRYTKKTHRYFPRDKAKKEGFIRIFLKKTVV